MADNAPAEPANARLAAQRRMRAELRDIAPDPLLTALEAAAETGRARSTFWRDVKRGLPGHRQPAADASAPGLRPLPPARGGGAPGPSGGGAVMAGRILPRRAALAAGLLATTATATAVIAQRQADQRNFWAPRPTGDYGFDCTLGERYAEAECCGNASWLCSVPAVSLIDQCVALTRNAGTLGTLNLRSSAWQGCT